MSIDRTPGMTRDQSTRRGALAQDLISGATASLVSCVATISFASLVFTGRMAPFLAEGVALALLSALLLSLFGLGLYRDPRLVLVPNPVAPIVALVVASAVATLPADAAPEAVYANGLAALAFSTMVTGALMFALGRLHLVAFSRYLPYPILIGMFGAVGWMFVAGAPGILGITLTRPADLLSLTRAQQVMALLSVALGFGLYSLPGRAPARIRSAVVPSLLVVFFVLFHGWRLASGLSLERLSAAGALIHVPGGGALVPLPGLDALAEIELDALLAAPGELASLAALTAMKATLMLSAIEAQSKLRLSAERTMTWAGLGSMLGAPLGGYPGHVSISMSMIISELGGRSARAYIGIIGVAALAYLGGATLLRWVPVPMIAGVLIYIGLSMLASALVNERARMSSREFVVVVALVLVQALAGLLPAVVTGLIAAVALFVYEYSRIEVIGEARSGRERQSSVPRDHQQRLRLLGLGERLRIFQLRGYLFFGTAERVVRIIEEALEREREGARPEHFVLDLAGVPGMDVSSAACFETIVALAEAANARLTLSGLNETMARALERVGVLGHARVSRRPDLDRAIEACEEALLREDDEARAGAEFLAELEALEAVALTAGERLITRGEPLDTVYFVASGALTIIGGDAESAREVGRGSVLGLGAHLRTIAAAYTVEAREDCQLYALTAAGLRALERDDPHLALALHGLISEQGVVADSADVEGLAEHLVERRLAPDELLVSEGERIDAIYFVVDGRLDVVIGGSSARLRSMGPGDSIGEISYYAHSAATATVLARSEVTVRALSREALERLERERPSAAAALHRRFCRELARRFAQDAQRARS